MFHYWHDQHDISVKLASVLEDIGVNEKTVQLRRRLLLLRENVGNITRNIIEDNRYWYHFGSQSEGTTTTGLNSDHDHLYCDNKYIVLQDISKWKPGAINLLMFQDESTPPGYCMLQIPDSTHPYLSQGHPEILTQFTKQYADKLMLKNSIKKQFKWDKMGEHGPAFIDESETVEYVYVIPFRSLPNFVSNWLKQQLQKERLTPNMKTYIECHPCYAVPVGCKGNLNEELEWRISTSHAERCVMFNLNITQIHCYVMLKLMLQTHLKHPSEQGLSSFMCKNILLLCIEDTDLDDWGQDNLVSLFRLCLLQLKHCVSEEYCPHFIMHENNLMAGKFKPKVKIWLLDKIHELYQNIVCHFLTLTTDEVGRRLQTKIDISSHHNFHFMNPENVSDSILHTELPILAHFVNLAHRTLLCAIVSRKTSFDAIIKKVIQLHHKGDSLEQAAILLLTPLIYSFLGSVMASSDIEQGQPVSPEALVWLSLGLDSDVTSGRLKLASVYYCSGEYSKAEAILRFTEDNYDTRMVRAMCACTIKYGKYGFYYIYGKDEQAIRHAFAYGVRFIQKEIHCVPKELQYEMFRSTMEDFKFREYHEISLVSKILPDYPKEMIPKTLRCFPEKEFVISCWMDWAVVDSLPYLYFLQFKTYGHLQRRADQIQALMKFSHSMITTAAFEHTETSWNLLGQCLVQENKLEIAYQCYKLSLKIRPRNNAASIHICRLLNSLISAK